MKSLMQRMSELQEFCSRTNDITIRIQIYQKLNELTNQINELVQNQPAQPPPIQYFCPASIPPAQLSTLVYPAQQPPIQSFIQRPPPHTIQFLSSQYHNPQFSQPSNQHYNHQFRLPSIMNPTAILNHKQFPTGLTHSDTGIRLNESKVPSTLLSYNLLRLMELMCRISTRRFIILLWTSCPPLSNFAMSSNV